MLVSARFDRSDFNIVNTDWKIKQNFKNNIDVKVRTSDKNW